MRKRRIPLLILVNIVVFYCSGFALNTDDKHLIGYEKVLTRAESNPFYKYGIYSSRIIAVKNPEVYLQGDMLFANFITTQPDYAKAYCEEVNSQYFMLPVENNEPFSFQMVDFSQYPVLPKEEIYGAWVSLYTFLDERITSIHTTLKTKAITSLEAANLMYIKVRVEGSPLNETFLIFTKERNAYLYCEGKYFDCLGKDIESETVKNPILVFNEEAVWYPLMDRDDSETNPVLKRLVAAIVTVDNKPSLSAVETKLVDQLKLVSMLNDSKQEELAAIYSIHYDGMRGIGDLIKRAVLSGYGRKRLYQNLLIMKIGNYLSPHTSYLSSMIKNRLETNLKNIEAVYLQKVGTRKEWQKGAFSAWAHTWPCTLIENNIDDAFRTRGGHCISQAMNLSAVLELAEVKNVFVNYRTDKHPHGIIILPQLNTSFSNGLLLGRDSYRNQKIVIEAGMIGDQLIVFNGAMIESNVIGQESARLHKTVSDLSNNFLQAKLFNPYSDDCFYQKIELP